MNRNKFGRKFFAFFVCLLVFTLFFSTEGAQQVNAAVNARFEKGVLRFSVEATKGATGGWRYRTVGFVITRKTSSSRTPMNLADKTDMIKFTTDAESPANASAGQSITVKFEISQPTVDKALKKSGANLADIAENGGTCYLHAMFQLIPPNKTKPETDSKVYKSYDEISKAKDWSIDTKNNLKDYYNIKANYDGNEEKKDSNPPEPGKVNIRHIDKDTNSVIHSEAKAQAVETIVTYTPKARGYFTKNGQPYVPISANQSYKMPKPAVTKTIDFYYRATVPNPSGERKAWYATSAAGDGNINWRLKKDDSTKESKVFVQNNIIQSGTHYQTRNHTKSIAVPGFSNQTDSGTYLSASIKGKNIIFNYSYEYTDWYYETYVPLESLGSDVFKWTLSKVEPLWNKGSKFTFSQVLTANHQQGENIEMDPGSATYQSLIGQSMVIGESIQNQYETFSFGSRDEQKLVAQTKLPIMQQPISYQNDFKEGFSTIAGDKLFLPADVDPNLQEKYANTSEYSDVGDYAFPLELGAVALKSGKYEIPYRSADDFYVTRNTGFILPVRKGTTIEDATATVATEYKEFTGATLDEGSDVLLGEPETDNSIYYIPIDSESKLEPKTTHTNHYVLGKMGLSDFTFIFGQPFSFDKYLTGSVFDDVYVNEQVAPVLDVVYPHSITLDKSQQKKVREIANNRTTFIHGFRLTDAKDIRDQLNKYISLEDDDSVITRRLSEVVAFGKSSDPKPETTITIPNLKRVVSVNADNGTVDFDVDGENVLIKPSNGSVQKEELEPETKEVEMFLETDPGGNPNFLLDSFEEEDEEGFSGTLVRTGDPILMSGECNAETTSKQVRIQRLGDVILRHDFDKNASNGSSVTWTYGTLSSKSFDVHWTADYINKSNGYQVNIKLQANEQLCFDNLQIQFEDMQMYIGSDHWDAIPGEIFFEGNFSIPSLPRESLQLQITADSGNLPLTNTTFTIPLQESEPMGSWQTWREGYLPDLFDYNENGFVGTLFPVSDDIDKKDGDVWFENMSESEAPPELRSANITYEGTVVQPPEDTRVWRQRYVGSLSKPVMQDYYSYVVKVVYEIE